MGKKGPLVPGQTVNQGATHPLTLDQTHPVKPAETPPIIQAQQWTNFGLGLASGIVGIVKSAIPVSNGSAVSGSSGGGSGLGGGMSSAPQPGNNGSQSFSGFTSDAGSTGDGSAFNGFTPDAGSDGGGSSFSGFTSDAGSGGGGDSFSGFESDAG